MMIQELEGVMSQALNAVGVDLPEGFQVQVESAADLRFGDYQSNAAMILAKRLRTNPREFAAKLIEVMELGDLAVADIAGPGFINFRVTHSAWSKRMSALLGEINTLFPNFEVFRITPLQLNELLLASFSHSIVFATKCVHSTIHT